MENMFLRDTDGKFVINKQLHWLLIFQFQFQILK